MGGKASTIRMTYLPIIPKKTNDEEKRGERGGRNRGGRTAKKTNRMLKVDLGLKRMRRNNFASIWSPLEMDVCHRSHSVKKALE